jgi:hypothetical protein
MHPPYRPNRATRVPAITGGFGLSRPGGESPSNFCNLILFIVGCATPEPLPQPDRFSASGPVKVVGDWDDVESAVRIGASQSEIAILKTDRPSETVYEFELLTITR